MIDDEPSIGELVGDILHDEGYVTRWARHGAEGLTLLEEWLPQLIILDLAMPVMDGWAFREEQRRRPSLAHVPVVVLSGARDTLQEGARLGASAALAKPFQLDALVDTVRRVLSATNTTPQAS